ncbi:MAG: hypothetical protein V1899_11005 [Planctomycetota bacterium]
MRKILPQLLTCAFFFSGTAFAFGIDIGPIHIHGTKIKVGSNIELKIVPDKIVRDEDEKDRVRKINGHRKGDTDDKFDIKVVWNDLDDDSKAVLKKLEKDTLYVMKLEKLDDDWKLLNISKDKDKKDKKEKDKDKEDKEKKKEKEKDTEKDTEKDKNKNKDKDKES